MEKRTMFALRQLLRRAPLRPVLLIPAALLAASSAVVAQTLPQEEALFLQYTPSATTPGPNVSDLASGDLDGDGDLDLLIADATSSRVRLLFNLGANGFTQVSLAPGGAPGALAVGDVDGDGDLDFVVGLDKQLRCYLNDGRGSFTPRAPLAFPAADSGSVSLTLLDSDGDGQLDAWLGLSDHALPSGSWTGGLIVALGDGSGGFTLQPTHELALPAFEVVVADLNGDGRPDAAELAGYTSASTIALAFGADGGFVNGASTYSAGLYAGDLACGDWDGDGDADLASGNKYSLSLLVNDGSGAFTHGQSLNVGNYVKGITAADLDRDGDLDLLANSGSASAMRLLSNDGGSFHISATIPSSVQGYALLLADTNGDGYPDPWAGDVYGQLSHGDSHALAVRYGAAKPNSLGALPRMGIDGQPLLGATGFAVRADNLLSRQPAILVVGLAPQSVPLFKGQLLVAEPWVLVPLMTGASSGGSQADASVVLPLTAPQLALLVDAPVFLQLWSEDPQQVDGTHASLTDGLRLQVGVP
jgi:FG-GAP-like repeat